MHNYNNTHTNGDVPRFKKEGNGVTIESYYPDDHGKPVHLHVNGQGSSTKIEPNGIPLEGQPALSAQQSKIVKRYLKEIKAIFKQLQKWVKINHIKIKTRACVYILYKFIVDMHTLDTIFYCSGA